MEYVNGTWRHSASDVAKMGLEEIYAAVKDSAFKERVLADCTNFANEWMDPDLYAAFQDDKWNYREVVKFEKGDRQAIGHWVREWAQVRLKLEASPDYWQNRKLSDEARQKDILSYRKQIPEEFQSASIVDFPSEGQKKIIENILKHGCSFMLVGDQGVGKTRLGWALWMELKAEGKKAVKFLKMFELKSILQDHSFKTTSMVDYINNAFVFGVDVLIVDEIDKISVTDAAFANLFYLVDRRCEEHRQTIFFGNGTKAAIEEKLGTSLMSRFNSKSYKSKVLELHGENRRLKDVAQDESA